MHGRGEHVSLLPQQQFAHFGIGARTDVPPLLFEALRSPGRKSPILVIPVYVDRWLPLRPGKMERGRRFPFLKKHCHVLRIQRMDAKDGECECVKETACHFLFNLNCAEQAGLAVVDEGVRETVTEHPCQVRIGQHPLHLGDSAAAVTCL